MERFKSNRPFSQDLISKIDSNNWYNYAWRRCCLVNYVMLDKEFLSKKEIESLIINHSQEWKFSGILKDLKDLDLILNISICLGFITKCDQ